MTADAGSEKRSRSVAWIMLAAALLLAIAIIRLGASAAYSATDAERAAAIAPNAPGPAASLAMLRIGEAAARGADPGPGTHSQLETVARAAPLAPEPFLFAGALAEKSGNYARAEALLRAALQRSPRSPAARYLLADTLFRQGKVAAGLKEMAALSRFIYGSPPQLVPALAEFAQSPGAADKLAGAIAANPQLRGPLLHALAADPANAPLVLKLANRFPGGPAAEDRAWQSRLIEGFVQRGMYPPAYGLWRRFAGVNAPPEAGVNDGSFRLADGPAPFSWAYPPTSAGVAEPGKNGLRVLYYGRENAVLATQLLLLAPGEYRLASEAAGQVGSGALAWVVSCRNSPGALARLVIGKASAPVAFTVPANGCGAQWLQLTGVAQEAPSDIDTIVSFVRIDRGKR